MYKKKGKAECNQPTFCVLFRRKLHFYPTIKTISTRIQTRPPRIQTRHTRTKSTKLVLGFTPRNLFIHIIKKTNAKNENMSYCIISEPFYMKIYLIIQ